jgi:hypothetical protein
VVIVKIIDTKSEVDVFDEGVKDFGALYTRYTERKFSGVVLQRYYLDLFLIALSAVIKVSASFLE